MTTVFHSPPSPLPSHNGFEGGPAPPQSTSLESRSSSRRQVCFLKFSSVLYYQQIIVLNIMATFFVCDSLKCFRFNLHFLSSCVSSLPDWSQLDEEHRLIAHYAARLASQTSQSVSRILCFYSSIHLIISVMVMIMMTVTE